MTNMRSEELTVGYCTNVHAGVDLPSIRENLDQFAVSVRQKLVGNGDINNQDSLGVGLWIPDQASRELVAGDAAIQFARFLKDRQLDAFTINGFPYDNFHQDVVKHQVYLPTWCDRRRLEYTQRLADILSAIMPGESNDSSASSASATSNRPPVGSISTLPIGWPDNPSDFDGQRDELKTIQLAGSHFRELADYLEKIESNTGQRIVVAIEPEPGCILDTTEDVIAFFETQLPDTSHRKYITVCHDVCHSAVMMEPQATVIQRLSHAGIGIGKVQVSSAILVDWESMADGRRKEAIEQLAEFAEDRYLHQTGCQSSDKAFRLAEDLPQLIQSVRDESGTVQDDRWAVHFHVPIFLQRFGHLATSQPDVLEVLRTLLAPETSVDFIESVEFTGHLEIETYAWSVLPESMRKRDLADDISQEIQWLRKSIEMVQ